MTVDILGKLAPPLAVAHLYGRPEPTRVAGAGPASAAPSLGSWDNLGKPAEQARVGLEGAVDQDDLPDLAGEAQAIKVALKQHDRAAHTLGLGTSLRAWVGREHQVLGGQLAIARAYYAATVGMNLTTVSDQLTKIAAVLVLHLNQWLLAAPVVSSLAEREIGGAW